MKSIFRIILAISLILTLFVLSACKGNGKEIDVPLDSSSNTSSQNVEENTPVSSEEASSENNGIDAEIQTGQDVVIDMGEEFFE